VRTISSDQDKYLTAADRSTHVRVRVDRGVSDFVDLTNFQGYDWLVSVEYSENVDDPVATANVQLHMRVESLSLATLMAGSKLNASGTILDPGNPIIIETCVLPPDSVPAASDWIEVFRGEIDEVDWTRNPISILCRDKGGTLLSRWIETQQKYPADPSTQDDVEDIMQAILTDHVGGVTLYFPDGTGGVPLPQGGATDPAWIVKEYIQSKQPVLEALRVLAGQIGWEVRYRWHANTSAFQLVFYKPDRTAVSPLRTFTKEQYFEPQGVRLSRVGVRNVVKVKYGLTDATRTSVTVTDASSITKYGRQYMEVAEAASSQIDALTEAQSMANAILNDLKDPSLEQSIPMPYFWPVEVGDLYRFSANDVHYDSNQDQAVVSVTHRITKDEAITVLGTRGKPSGGFVRWLGMEGRSGLAQPTDFYTDEAAQNPVATAGLGTIVVVYDDPRSMSPPISDWSYTECHVSTTNGFAPSGSTKVAQGKTTRFEVGDLVPGTTYYVKLIIYDGAGNKAATSTQVSTATERVGPYHENRDGQQDQLLRNNDFNVWTKGATIVPDAWSMVTGTWNTDIVRGSADPATGNYHIDFSVVSGGMQPVIESDFMPIAGGTADSAEILQAAIIAKRSGGSTNSRVNLDVRFYDAAKAFLSANSTSFTPTAAYVTYQTTPFLAPTTARYCKVRITGTYSVGVTYTLRVDRASLLRGYAFGHAGYNAGPNNPFANADTVLEFNDTRFTDSIGVTYIAGALNKNAIEVIYPGTYIPSIYAVSVDNTPTNHKFDLQIQLDTGGGYATVASINGTSRPRPVTEICWLTCVGPPTFMDKGDRMRVLYNTQLADNATRDVQCLDISLKQIVRGDQ
jgi:hypothetical protein